MKEALMPDEAARKLNFGSAGLLMRYASYMTAIGLNREAVSAIERAKALDPLNSNTHRIASFVHLSARNYEAAIESAQRVLDINSRSWNAHVRIGISRIYLGQIEKGLAVNCNNITLWPVGLCT